LDRVQLQDLEHTNKVGAVEGNSLLLKKNCDSWSFSFLPK